MLESAQTQSNKSAQRAFSRKFNKNASIGKQIWTWHKDLDKAVCAGGTDLTCVVSQAGAQTFWGAGAQGHITYLQYIASTLIESDTVSEFQIKTNVLLKVFPKAAKSTNVSIYAGV